MKKLLFGIILLSTNFAFAIDNDVCTANGFDCYDKSLGQCVVEGQVRLPHEILESTRNLYWGYTGEEFIEQVYPALVDAFQSEYAEKSTRETLEKHKGVVLICY